MYQIAETVGMLPDQIRDRLSSSDLCEWAVYLNSPFSGRGRDTLMNAWLVHTIRSIVSDKAHRPKFSDSRFPFDKLYREFFANPIVAAPKAGEVKKGARKSVGEADHMAQVWRKRFEQATADFRAGRTVNRFGLKYGERMKS